MNPRRPPWRRWLLRATWLAVTFATVAVVGAVAFRWAERRELQALLDETTAADPRWTLADHVADRPAVPADRDATAVVTAYAARHPRAVTADLSDMTFGPLRLGDRLRPGQRATLAQLFPPDTDARWLANELADRPGGRRDRPWAAGPQAAIDWWLTRVSYHPSLVRYDLCEALRLLTDTGDRDAAVRAWRAVWNLGRVADVPTIDVILGRCNVRQTACGAAVRMLAARPWTDYQLAAMQAEIAADLSADLLTPALRAERAFADAWLIEAAAEPAVRDRYFHLTTYAASPLQAKAERVAMALPGYFDRQRRDHLLAFRAALEMAALPEPKRYDAIHAHAREARTRREARPVVWWDVPRLTHAVQRDAAALRCTVALLACERFRLRTGRFPTTLDEVVAAGLLPAVPRDPCAAGPLRLARRNGGIVVYSVGDNGRDDGGDLRGVHLENDEVCGVGADWGVWLLPLSQRGRPPLEKKP